jgi:chromosome segregation ATPase
MSDALATLATKITGTEQELQEVKADIKTIRTGDDAAVKALGYDGRDEARAHLPRLEAKEEQLNERLNTYEKQKLTALTQQQQQSGAGTSMLRVRLALVIFLPQRSCCMLANLVACRVCLVACNPA